MRNSAVLGRKQTANKYNKSVSDGDVVGRITEDRIFPYWESEAAQWHDCIIKHRQIHLEGKSTRVEAPM